jgi:hypothetical protein
VELNGKITYYLGIYIKYLDSHITPTVDPDIYKIMTHVKTLPIDQRILCLTKYLTMKKSYAYIGNKKSATEDRIHVE